MVTFVDPAKVRSSNPGFCFHKAGFRRVGQTVGGLPCLQLLPADMPAAVAPPGSQSRLFDMLPAALPASA